MTARYRHQSYHYGNIVIINTEVNASSEMYLMPQTRDYKSAFTLALSRTRYYYNV